MRVKKNIDVVKVIKSKLSIKKVLEYYGHDNIVDGNNECKFHNSKGKNSLLVDAIYQRCHCFKPNCVQGDVLSVIAFAENLDIKEDFPAILKKAYEITGEAFPDSNIDFEKAKRQIEQSKQVKKSREIFFRFCKPKLKMVNEYLAIKRGLNKNTSLDLGYFPESEWNNFVSLMKKENPKFTELCITDKDEKKYLIDKYYSLTNRIIHPHRDRNGEIMYFTGEVTPNCEEGADKYIKINTVLSDSGKAEPYLFNTIFQNKDVLIFAEGFWDALKLAILGYQVITFGTCKISNHFIDKYYRHLQRFKKVIICFDTEDNEAGLDGAKSLAKRLTLKGLRNIHISTLEKEGEKIDIDGLTKKETDTVKQKQIIEDKIVLPSKHYFDFVIDNINETNIEKEIRDLLISLRNQSNISLELVFNKIAKTLKINKKTLEKEFKILIQQKDAEDSELLGMKDPQKKIYIYKQIFSAITDFFLDEGTSPWIVYEDELINAEKDHFKNIIMNVYLEKLEEINSSNCKDVQKQICAMTSNRTKNLKLRSRRKDKNWLFQLNKNSYLELNPEKIIVKKEVGLFKVFENQEDLEVDLSAKIEDIYLLKKYIYQGNEIGKEAISSLIASLGIPETQKPIFILVGYPGSGKSKSAQFISTIFDPTSNLKKGQPLPKNEEQFALLCESNLVLFYDNLTNINKETQDNLCRITTGTVFQRRKLYTNSDKVTVYAMNPQIITSVGLNLLNPDVIDRAFIFEFQSIEKDKVMRENELNDLFNLELPKIRGAMFKLLHAIYLVENVGKEDINPSSVNKELLQEYFDTLDTSLLKKIYKESIKYTPDYRLKDYMTYVSIANNILTKKPEEFYEEMTNLIDFSVSNLLNNEPFVQVLIKYLDLHTRLEGTPTEIYEKLRTVEDQKSGITLKQQGATGIGRKINEIGKKLHKIGIDFKNKKGKERIYSFEYIEKNKEEKNDDSNTWGYDKTDFDE